eukprot:6179353-Pleurochrysis_carterae.AAC.1
MHPISRAEDLNVQHQGVPLHREQVVGAPAACSPMVAVKVLQDPPFLARSPSGGGGLYESVE